MLTGRRSATQSLISNSWIWEYFLIYLSVGQKQYIYILCHLTHPLDLRKIKIVLVLIVFKINRSNTTQTCLCTEMQPDTRSSYLRSVIVSHFHDQIPKQGNYIGHTNATRYEIQLLKKKKVNYIVSHFYGQLPKRVNYLVSRTATRYEIQLLKNTQINWFCTYFD